MFTEEFITEIISNSGVIGGLFILLIFFLKKQVSELINFLINNINAKQDDLIKQQIIISQKLDDISKDLSKTLEELITIQKDQVKYNNEIITTLTIIKERLLYMNLASGNSVGNSVGNPIRNPNPSLSHNPTQDQEKLLM